MSLPKSVKDFIDACIACQEFSKREHSKSWRDNQSDMRPSDYDRYGCVEWPHLYFGARRCWTDPWDCMPGQECLCTDPITDPQIDQLITQCLTSSKPSPQTLCSLSIEQLQLREPAHSKSRLMRCPTEILQIIVSHLPLRSAINLHASSHRLSALVNTSKREFWRPHTLRLHDPWFWELRDHQGFSPESVFHLNWEKLLKILTLSRREILKEAQPY